MKKITLVFVGILILFMVYFLFWGQKFLKVNTKNNNSFEEVNIVIPIDTEQEAIYLATEKSDGVSNFSANYNKFGEIIVYAKFYEDKNYWLVIFYPENTQDLSYEVHVSLEGNIIYESSSMGG